MAYFAFLPGSTHSNGGALLLEDWQSLDGDHVVDECPEQSGWAGKAWTSIANRVCRMTREGNLYHWNGARWEHISDPLNTHKPKDDAA